MPALGPYSKPNTLAKLDGRTKEARLIAQTRADLVAHCGGKPSATQRRLIERACWLTLHCALIDAKALAGGDVTLHDGRTYLAWSNALSRTLVAIGLKPPPEAAPKTLQDHIAERARVA